MATAADTLKTLQDNIKSLDAASKSASTATDFFDKADSLGTSVGGPAGDAFKSGVNGAKVGIATGAGVGTAVGAVALTAGATAAAASVVPVIGTVIGAVAGLIAGIAAFFAGKASAAKKAKIAELLKWWGDAATQMRTVLMALPSEFRDRAVALLDSEMKASGGYIRLKDGKFDIGFDDEKKEPELREVIVAFPDKLLHEVVPGWLKDLNEQAAAMSAQRRRTVGEIVLGAALLGGLGWALYTWEKRR
jgi:hypothetical protein